MDSLAAGIWIGTYSIFSCFLDAVYSFCFPEYVCVCTTVLILKFMKRTGLQRNGREKENRFVWSPRKDQVVLNILTLVVCVKGTNKEHFLGYSVGFKNSKQLPILD